MDNYFDTYLLWRDADGPAAFEAVCAALGDEGATAECRLAGADGPDGTPDLPPADAVRRVVDHGTGTVSLPVGGVDAAVYYGYDHDVVPDAGPTLLVRFPYERFDPRTHDDGQSAMETVVDRLLEAVAATSPDYGAGVVGGDGLERILDGEEFDRGVLRDVSWLTVLSPRFVDRIGRDRVRSTPAWRVESFDDGTVALVLTDNVVHPGEEYRPPDPYDWEWTHPYDEARTHLGLE